MTDDYYRPRHLLEVRAMLDDRNLGMLPAVERREVLFEALKEISSRGLYGRNSKGVIETQQDIYGCLGSNIFENLFCEVFDKALYPYFDFSKKYDDESRLLRYCRRAVIAHTLRGMKHLEDAGSSLYSKKVMSMHDIVENQWKKFFALAILRKIFEKGHYELLAKQLNINFINYDFLKIDADKFRGECDGLLSLVIEPKFGTDLAFSTNFLTNRCSIDEKLDILDKYSKKAEFILNGIIKVEKEKDLTYLTDITEIALMAWSEIYKGILEARTGDRIDNMATLFYLQPLPQIVSAEKTIQHVKGSLTVIEAKNISYEDSFFKLILKLLQVSDDEISRSLDYHRKEPAEGYKAEYNTEKIVFSFSEKLGEVRDLRKRTNDIKEEQICLLNSQSRSKR